MATLDPKELKEQLEKNYSYSPRALDAISKALEALEKAQADVAEIEGISIAKIQRDMGQLLHLKFSGAKAVSPWNMHVKNGYIYILVAIHFDCLT